MQVGDSRGTGREGMACGKETQDIGCLAPTINDDDEAYKPSSRRAKVEIRMGRDSHERSWGDVKLFMG